MLALTMLATAALSLTVINCASQTDAQIQAAIHATELGARIADSVGPSMLPVIGNPAIVLIVDIPYTEITERAIVLRDAGGLVSCHRAEKRYGDEWVMKGDNLPKADFHWLTRANYRGAVAMIFNYPKP